MIAANVAQNVQAVATLISHLRLEMSDYAELDTGVEVPKPQGIGKLLMSEGGYGICEEIVKRAVEVKGPAAVAALLALGGAGAAGVAAGSLVFAPVVVIGGARVIAERKRQKAERKPRSVVDAERAMYARGDVDDMLVLSREFSAAHVEAKKLIEALTTLSS
jgi:hypothetical protein